MVVPFVTCCGWFSNLGSSSGAWDTRHCLLTGRSIGEGEVGWSILVIKISWIRNYARGAFIADNSHEAAVISTSASSPRIDHTLERPVNS
ncbi:unnamed protein product [Penicillium nalgiovense]|uniref:Uncharacterized protein n=1 Tax=Penicillium nalgiovense TaxID=60175 RepID=A0A9W4MTA9_PENNA|nr:unnamed protein product [Penicillium nalgiovense]CAG8074269.1 unnamed protein product [Penicillium nalgiovense]CAG8080467.1 unnamed protein product [Penicillium nalgiovense]CAG8086906.1 unnamed protein product [Penicillium nalgiovense]CAG8088683.1 unnamed protein product [Penicillium nalgiovense]